MAMLTNRFLGQRSASIVAGLLAWVATIYSQPCRCVEAQENARRADQEQIVFWRQRSVGLLDDSVLEAVRLKDKKVTKLATRSPALGGAIGSFCVALSPDGRRAAYMSGAFWTDKRPI